jgi:signal transduction histidine kinase
MLRRRLALVLAGAVAVLVVAVATVAIQIYALRMDGWLDHATRTQVKIRRIYVALLAAESGQRGFVLTGDRRYLVPYQQAIGEVVPALEQLDVSLERRDAIRGHVDAVRRLATTKLAVMERTLALVNIGDRAGAVGVVNTDTDESLMGQLRVELDAILREVDADIGRRRSELRARMYAAMGVVAIGSMLIFAGLVIGIRSVRSDAAARSQAFDQLAVAAESMERNQRTLDAYVAELQSANAALSRSNRDLDSFAYVASHDLRAPLRGISNLATWLEEDLGDRLDDRNREHLALLRGRVDRMGLLIEGILVYSRAGRRPGEVTAVDVGELVRDVVALLVTESTTVVIADGLPTLHTERVPLEQVWINLLDNAIKHGTPGGRIEIGGTRRGDLGSFWVRDDGPGIPPEHHEKIFDVFQTLSPRDKVEGAGIGLSVVRKLVESHGGTIRVESTAGDGATFHFTWRASESRLEGAER